MTDDLTRRRAERADVERERLTERTQQTSDELADLADDMTDAGMMREARAVQLVRSTLAELARHMRRYV